MNGTTPTSTLCDKVIAFPQFVNYEFQYDSIKNIRYWEFKDNIESVVLDSDIQANPELNNEFLDAKWGSGFTKGISLNREDKTITYWVMKW